MPRFAPEAFLSQDGASALAVGAGAVAAGAVVVVAGADDEAPAREPINNSAAKVHRVILDFIHFSLKEFLLNDFPQRLSPRAGSCPQSQGCARPLPASRPLGQPLPARRGGKQSKPPALSLLYGKDRPRRIAARRSRVDADMTRK